jgi:hypothetical protein
MGLLGGKNEKFGRGEGKEVHTDNSSNNNSDNSTRSSWRTLWNNPSATMTLISLSAQV